MAIAGMNTTVEFNSSSTTSIWSANVVSVDGMGALSRADIDTSHLGTTGGFKTFMPGGLVDPGTVEMTIQHIDGPLPPVTRTGSTGDTVTVHFGTTGKPYWSGPGYMNSYQIQGMDQDGLVTASVAFKLSGAVTATSST